jgi:predicted permease
VVLVIGAGLMLRSFWNLMQVDSGFDRTRLATFQLVLPAPKYPEMPRRSQFFNDLAVKLREIPGVQAAAAMQGLPPLRQVNANDTQIEGWEPVEGAPPQNVDYYQTVTSDYVATMGIPIVNGRGFSISDGPTTTPAVLINETMARTFYKDRDPIGRRVKPSFGGNTPWFTIIGVVKDVKQGGLDQKTGTELYFLHDQGAATIGFAPGNMNMVIRSTLPLDRLAPSIRRIVGDMDRSLPIVNLRTMDQVFSDAVSRPRFLSQLLAVFAGLALLLAAVGTYGILAYTVTERTREIGIRMALGAHRDRVLGMVLRQGMTVTGAGIVIGIVSAIAINRLASTLLFGVKPTDPATFAIVAGFIIAVALVACIIPARRATRVDPMVALRDG